MGCHQSVKGDVLQSLLVYIRMHNLQVLCPFLVIPPLLKKAVKRGSLLRII